MNYKDFCGSQELNKYLKNQQLPYYINNNNNNQHNNNNNKLKSSKSFSLIKHKDTMKSDQLESYNNIRTEKKKEQG